MARSIENGDCCTLKGIYWSSSMRSYSLVLLSFFCSLAFAGILPEAEREEIVSLVHKNFWGRAKLSNGDFAHPSSETERNTVPVSKVIASRSIDAGELSGLAMWCKLDWEPNYFSLTNSARKKGLSDKQVAFISMLHGVAQQRVSSTMANSACDAKYRRQFEQMLKESMARGLGGT